jgi:hypothetical protein
VVVCEVWLHFYAKEDGKEETRSTRASVRVREWSHSRVNFARISINLFRGVFKD